MGITRPELLYAVPKGDTFFHRISGTGNDPKGSFLLRDILVDRP